MQHFFQIYKAKDDDETAPHHKPHSHNFEEVVVVLTGKVEQFIDCETYSFSAPCVYYTAQGKTHQTIPVLSQPAATAWVIRFTEEFIGETGFHLYSLRCKNLTIQFTNDEEFERLGQICAMMQAESENKEPDYALLRQFLKTFFALLESRRKKITKQAPENPSHKTEHFAVFVSLLEKHFRTQHSVEFYAKEMNMTARNLNLICNEIASKSISELLENRRILEAKNLLLSSEKNISEIGYEIGYQEKAYFSAVFKKRNGISPSQFRKNMKRFFN